MKKLSREDGERYSQLNAYRESLRGDLQRASDPQAQAEVQRKIDEVEGRIRSIAPDSGYVYEVEIPNDDVMVRSRAKFGAGESLDDLNGLAAYRLLAKQLGSQRTASEALKDEGVYGLRYFHKGDGECAVVWTEEAISIREFLQRAKENGQIRGAYSPSENRITLTLNADITTFSHEMGHWWLANAIELSKSNQTDLSLRKDVRTLLDVFGVKDQVDWDSLGIEGQRRYHEAFASWVEEYLTTGRVPDGRVQSLLEKFRTWILKIYRDFRAHLNERYRKQFGEDLPQLSDEVRDILDRNLALEDAQQAVYRSFAPSHASADAARYAAYQGQIRADQPVTQAIAQEMTASIFEESKAADALDAREKVEVNPPVDVDRARGEQQMLKNRLGGDEAFAPKDPNADADLPVYEIPRRSEPVPAPDTEDVEPPSWQDQLVGTLRRFFGGEDADTGASAPEPQPQIEPRRPANVNAGDEARVRAQAESILEQHPDMPVVAAPRPEDADLPAGPRTAAEVMEAAEREASEAERFAGILDSAAQCVLKNGGMNA